MQGRRITLVIVLVVFALLLAVLVVVGMGWAGQQAHEPSNTAVFPAGTTVNRTQAQTTFGSASAYATDTAPVQNSTEVRIGPPWPPSKSAFSRSQLLAVQHAIAGVVQPQDDEGDTDMQLVMQTETYSVYFSELFTRLFVIIRNGPVLQVRIQAETAVAGLLGVTREDLCNYAISITTLPQKPDVQFNNDVGLILCNRGTSIQ